jgi:hypothetical protein
MRASLSNLLHAEPERRRLRTLVRNGQATDEQRERLDTFTERLLDGLLDEVAQLSRDVAQVSIEARRRRPY